MSRPGRIAKSAVPASRARWQALRVAAALPKGFFEVAFELAGFGRGAAGQAATITTWVSRVTVDHLNVKAGYMCSQSDGACIP